MSQVMTQGSRSSRRGAPVVSVRLTEDELEQLRAEAERAGVPLSVYVRQYIFTRTPATPVGTHPNNGTTKGSAAVQYDYVDGKLIVRNL